MNSTHPPGSQEASWTRGRWIAVVATLAAIQAAILLGVTRWPSLAPLPPPGTPSPRLEISVSPGRDAERFAGNPRQFAGPDPSGFSGSASRALPPPEYTLAEWPGRPRWLAADGNPQRIGTSPTPESVPSLRPIVMPPAAISNEARAPLLLPPHTVVSPRGNLAGRTLTGAPPPPILPGTEVLNPTVVEVAVTRSGDVVLARVTGASGNPEADQRALAWSQNIRFPGQDAGAEDPIQAGTLTWGELAFYWRVQTQTP